MAKEFVYKQQHGGQCLDDCTFTNEGIMIGSMACHAACKHNQHVGDRFKVVTCPKIIRRSLITGKVIMRKPWNHA
jgi:hypothetical protein